MPNNYLSMLYQHIIQVENKNVGLKVEGHKHTIAPPPPVKKVWGGGTCPPCPPPPPPASYASVYIYYKIIKYVFCNPFYDNADIFIPLKYSHSKTTQGKRE